MTNAFQISNLDYYQEMISLGTEIYKSADEMEAGIGGKLKEHSLSAVLNLASGLGFWEKEWKIQHFLQCKKALIEIGSLIEVCLALGALTQEQRDALAPRVHDMVKRISGLVTSTEKRAD